LLSGSQLTSDSPPPRKGCRTADSDCDPRQVGRAFYDSYSARDLEASFDAYIHPDLINHAMGAALDRQAWKALDKNFIQAFDEVEMVVFDQIGEGDGVAARSALSGTQKAQFAGQAPRGHTPELTATSVDRLQDGKIAEHWIDNDFTGFLQRPATPEV
jgi:predicted ester cyclase